MDSAKVAVLGRGTAVRLLQRCVGATGALRVRVRDANAGVSFLRTRVGAVGVPDAETPVLVVLHGTSYNAGVWIPTFKRLHEVWAPENLSFEAWIVEWAGHGRSRAVACPDIDVDRYELTREGPFDVQSVLGHGDAARVKAGGPSSRSRTASAPRSAATRSSRRRAPSGHRRHRAHPVPALDKPPSGAADASGLIKGTLVKKKHFDVPSEDGVVDYLTKTAMGKQWEGEAVRSFVAHGVAPAAGGGFDLRCDPAVEAAIYVNSGRSAGRAYERLQDIDCPCFTCIGHDSAMNGNGSSQAHRDNGKLRLVRVVRRRGARQYRGPDYAGLTYEK
ncbi:hypothetical protein JL720_2794 [Aureococcus anophagefferens]|nr:hypothetical protein JL720_2794 [Aureococcus anophagefferens]